MIDLETRRNTVSFVSSCEDNPVSFRAVLLATTPNQIPPRSYLLHMRIASFVMRTFLVPSLTMHWDGSDEKDETANIPGKTRAAPLSNTKKMKLV